MLVQSVMTKDVITVSKDTPITDAMKIMKEHNFSRLPVVDKKGKLAGMVTQGRLERIKPSATAPVLWQLTYLLSHTKVGDIMRKKVVTVSPTDTVEHAIAKAQLNRVGTLIVLDKDKIIGICTTTDFFYKIVNPTLGLGESGTRILINGGGDGKKAEKILHCINNLGIGIKLVWTSPSSTAKENDMTIQLDTDDVTQVLEEMKKCGFDGAVRTR